MSTTLTKEQVINIKMNLNLNKVIDILRICKVKKLPLHRDNVVTNELGAVTIRRESAASPSTNGNLIRSRGLFWVAEIEGNPFRQRRRHSWCARIHPNPAFGRIKIFRVLNPTQNALYHIRHCGSCNRYAIMDSDDWHWSVKPFPDQAGWYFILWS